MNCCKNLILDPVFKPRHSQSDVAFEAFAFHGGEQHVKIKDDCKGFDVWISSRLIDGNSFMRFAVAVDAVRNAGGFPCGFIGYLPYARQDRVMVPGEPHSLRVFTSLLQSLDLKRLRIFDPHSDVAAALLPGVEVIDNSAFVANAIDKLGRPLTIVSPDAGAIKKIYSLCKSIGFSGPVAIGSKVRDVSNGVIVRQSIDGDVAGQVCLIVDDIIDGGRTFQDLAILLRERGAKEIHLAVSHGIFSQGTKHLRGPLDSIFVTNSFRDMNGPQDVGFVHSYDLTFEG